MQVVCENSKCKIIFKKSEVDFKRSKHHYCSKSCATKVNNKKYPKRSLEGVCCNCKTPIEKRYKYCHICNPFKADYSKITFGEIKLKRKDRQRYVHIRNLSRRAYLKSNRRKECLICGYDLHFDVCHIEPIYSFPDKTPVSEIISLNNLVALCKNHHWEFDNGFLSLDFPEFDCLHT